jgi:hypothetical protein
LIFIHSASAFFYWNVFGFAGAVRNAYKAKGGRKVLDLMYWMCVERHFRMVVGLEEDDGFEKNNRMKLLNNLMSTSLDY